MESARVGKRGAIIVPAKLRKRFGIEEGTIVLAEERDDGILIRPAVLVPVERYSPERKAEFLLSTATTNAGGLCAAMLFCFPVGMAATEARMNASSVCRASASSPSRFSES